MPLTFFEEIEESNGDGDRLFCKEYLEQNPRENGKQFPVRNIKLVKSGKGFIIDTDYFMCWIWKKSKIAGFLIEALETYVSQGQGFTIYAVLDKTTKDCFRLAADPDVPSYWYELGKLSYSTHAPSSLEGMKGNPFLPVAPSPNPEMTMTPVATLAAGGRGQQGRKSSKAS